MELITLLRALWRGRYLLVLSGLVALGIGAVVAFHVTFAFPPHLQSRQYKVALGSANVLVDTPDSQVIDLSPNGADSVGTRANLLANLITTSPIKNAIAQHVGLPPDKLVILAPPTGSVLAVTPAQAQSTIAGAGRDANIIAIRIDPTLPVISVDTQAADTGMAVRLANGAVAGLDDYLQSVAATQKVPRARRLVLRQLGEAQVAVTSKGPRRLYGLVAAFFFFLLACATIVLLPGLVRGLKAAAEADRLAKEGAAKAKADAEAPPAEPREVEIIVAEPLPITGAASASAADADDEDDDEDRSSPSWRIASRG